MGALLDDGRGAGIRHRWAGIEQARHTRRCLHGHRRHEDLAEQAPDGTTGHHAPGGPLGNRPSRRRRVHGTHGQHQRHAVPHPGPQRPSRAGRHRVSRWPWTPPPGRRRRAARPVARSPLVAGAGRRPVGDGEDSQQGIHRSDHRVHGRGDRPRPRRRPSSADKDHDTYVRDERRHLARVVGTREGRLGGPTPTEEGRSQGDPRRKGRVRTQQANALPPHHDVQQTHHLRDRYLQLDEDPDHRQ